MADTPAVKLTREEQLEIYEWGEIERDAAQLRDFSPSGGWLALFWTWVESKAREGREEVRKGARSRALLDALEEERKGVMSLTADQIAILRETPFEGPEIGSNFWPYLCLDCDGKDVDGTVIDALARNGFLTVHPVESPRVVSGVEDIPDIECRWEYLLTDLGRAALASERKP